MTEKMFVYEIQAFAYSDFEDYILVHEKQFTETEFRKMIEIARQKAKKKMITDDDFFWKYNYPDNFIHFLKEDFGFKDSEHLVAYTGCDFDDVATVEVSK